jgi:hypothetical protein
MKIFVAGGKCNKADLVLRRRELAYEPYHLILK